MKDYSVSSKIKYYSNLSKKGSRDNNGKLLSDFQRGVCFGKAKMLGYCASKLKNKKTNNSKYTPNMNTRNYTDEELNKLFDNYDGGLDD